MIAINQIYSINTPDSAMVYTQIRLASQARQMGFRPRQQLICSLCQTIVDLHVIEKFAKEYKISVVAT